MNEGRFVRVFAESPFSIWVDRETGVNYVFLHFILTKFDMMCILMSNQIILI